MPRRVVLLRLLAVLAGLGLLAYLIGAIVVFSAPDPVPPEDADVIVALGGTNDRAKVAWELWRDGVADQLVISRVVQPNSIDPNSVASRIYCADPPEHLRCFDPDPNTTRGEARAIAHLVEQEGWRQVVVVTTSYHARRAGVVIGQCTDAEITVVHAHPARNPAENLWWVIHETGGLLDLLLDPEC